MVNKQERWRHNSFFGHAAMMQAQARAIIDSPTTNSAAKTTAREIIVLAQQLEKSLKERIDK